MEMTKIVTSFALLSAIAVGQQYVISTFAGGGPTPTPIIGTKMAVAPQGMTVDASGNLFFISLNCVFKLDQKGIVTRVAGNSRTGYSGDGGPALSATFNTASGLAVDATGNIYVADLINRRIRRVSPAGIVTTFAG